MEITPKQLHHYTGYALGLAAESHCVRSYGTRSNHSWFMLFPIIHELDEGADGSYLEIDKRLSMRIGRAGMRGWKLTIFDVTDILRTKQEATAPLLEGSQMPLYDTPDVSDQAALRVIYSFRWNKTGVFTSSKRHQALVPGQKIQGMSNALNYISSGSDSLCDLVLPEVDIATPTREDLERLREDLTDHVSTYRRLSGTKS